MPLGETRYSTAGRGRFLGALVMVSSCLALGCTSSNAANGPVDGSADSTALGPGCLGSPGASCSPYPEGTVCPGPPTVCVPCGSGVYTLTESVCHCTSSAWDCTLPAPGEVQCPSPVGRYVDPACTVPYGNDGGDAGTGIDATACSIVLASNYDQSCVVDTDCVAVGEVSSCPATGCDGCTTEAINKLTAPQYQAAFAAAFASRATDSFCGCPCESGAICRAGKCQAAFCGPPVSDTLPACADAGGRCAYSANTTCSGMGPPDACAYSDELCCL